jgi:hypothetical protein
MSSNKKNYKYEQNNILINQKEFRIRLQWTLSSKYEWKNIIINENQ